MRVDKYVSVLKILGIIYVNIKYDIYYMTGLLHEGILAYSMYKVSSNLPSLEACPEVI